MIKYLILDLDDTIFPTKSINPVIFQPFINKLIETNSILDEMQLQLAIIDLWKYPFRSVAQKYSFTDTMIKESIHVLNTINYNFSITTYEDYHFLKNISHDKFLVTSGIPNLQYAKIDALQIRDDYVEIFIDDPSIESKGKIEIFELIIRNQKLEPHELLVIGDNPDSEIKAGKELNIPTILINRNDLNKNYNQNMITSFSQLPEIINNY